MSSIYFFSDSYFERLKYDINLNMYIVHISKTGFIYYTYIYIIL